MKVNIEALYNTCMKKIISKAAKETASLGGAAIRSAFSAILSEIVRDIMQESGAANMAKDTIMDVGFKVVKEMGVDPKSVQRELIKTAIMKELNLRK